MWGRDDLTSLYAAGAKSVENLVPTLHGSLESRPGMIDVDEIETVSAAPVVRPTKLLRWMLNETDVLLVVLTGPASYAAGQPVGHMRFYSPDGVRINNGDGTPVEVEHPYSGFDLPYLDAQQMGNALLITCRAHAPMYLRRTTVDGRTWTFTEALAPTPAYGGARPALNFIAEPAADPPTYPAREWVFYVTEVRRYDDGRTVETLPQQVTDMGAHSSTQNRFIYDPLTTNKHLLYPHAPIELWFGKYGLVHRDDYDVIATYVYRGRGLLLKGFVGGSPGPQNVDSTPPTDITGQIANFNRRYNRYFLDEGEDPLYTRPPPAGRDPFHQNGQFETPNACAFFADRQVFGGTWDLAHARMGRADVLFFSREGSFTNYDLAFPGFATAPFAFERSLVSGELEEIRSMVGLDQLLVFTATGVWTVDGPISAVDNVVTSLISRTGASWLRPLVLPNAVLFTRVHGDGALALSYSNEGGGYVESDVTLTASHLFDTAKITSWTYASRPWGVGWAATDDNQLLSFTYSPSFKLLAWARHPTDGEVECTLALPNGAEDAVFHVTLRNGQRRLERFASRKITAVEDAVCLDAAVEDADFTTTATGYSVSGLDHLEDQEVYALVDGDVEGPFTVASGAILLELRETAPTKVHVGLRFTWELQPLDLPDRTKKKVVKRIFVDAYLSRGMQAGGSQSQLTEWLPRRPGDGFVAIPLRTELAEMRILAGWARDGALTLTSSDPLPVTIFGLTREYEQGGT